MRKYGTAQPGLSVIDVATGRVLRKVKLDGDPHGVAVRPESGTAESPPSRRR